MTLDIIKENKPVPI